MRRSRGSTDRLPPHTARGTPPASPTTPALFRHAQRSSTRNSLQRRNPRPLGGMPVVEYRSHIKVLCFPHAQPRPTYVTRPARPVLDPAAPAHRNADNPQLPPPPVSCESRPPTAGASKAQKTMSRSVKSSSANAPMMHSSTAARQFDLCPSTVVTDTPARADGRR